MSRTRHTHDTAHDEGARAVQRSMDCRDHGGAAADQHEADESTRR